MLTKSIVVCMLVAAVSAAPNATTTTSAPTTTPNPTTTRRPTFPPLNCDKCTSPLRRCYVSEPYFKCLDWSKEKCTKYPPGMTKWCGDWTGSPVPVPTTPTPTPPPTTTEAPTTEEPTDDCEPSDEEPSDEEPSDDEPSDDEA